MIKLSLSLQEGDPDLPQLHRAVSGAFPRAFPVHCAGLRACATFDLSEGAISHDFTRAYTASHVASSRLVWKLSDILLSQRGTALGLGFPGGGYMLKATAKVAELWMIKRHVGRLLCLGLSDCRHPGPASTELLRDAL